jgi:hypothetical protein
MLVREARCIVNTLLKISSDMGGIPSQPRFVDE